MQRHLSTGSHMLAALMQSDHSAGPDRRQADPLHDVVQLLAEQARAEGETGMTRPEPVWPN